MLLPGATLLTLTPSAAHSTARDLVRLSTPALAAPGNNMASTSDSIDSLTSVGHHREASEHVRNDIDYDSTMLCHVLLVGCEYENNIITHNYTTNLTSLSYRYIIDNHSFTTRKIYTFYQDCTFLQSAHSHKSTLFTATHIPQLPNNVKSSLHINTICSTAHP